ncbi:MAG: hypothetical protein H6765_07120 [Candidatus Peribacteria bacterium]|nr:MAG: hypothetical protein H6765_07120 [Candidatus Peribacteria bacterium]
MLHGIVFPNGTLTVLGMQHAQGENLPEEGQLTRANSIRETQDIKALVQRLGEENIFTSFSDISITEYTM